MLILPNDGTPENTNVTTSTIRRVEHKGDFVITSNENIIVIDHGCDQSIVNIDLILIDTCLVLNIILTEHSTR